MRKEKAEKKCQMYQRLMLERFLTSHAQHTRERIYRSEIDVSSKERTNERSSLVLPWLRISQEFPNHQVFCVTFNVTETYVFSFCVSLQAIEHFSASIFIKM